MVKNRNSAQHIDQNFVFECFEHQMVVWSDFHQKSRKLTKNGKKRFRVFFSSQFIGFFLTVIWLVDYERLYVSLSIGTLTMGDKFHPDDATSLPPKRQSSHPAHFGCGEPLLSADRQASLQPQQRDHLCNATIIYRWWVQHDNPRLGPEEKTTIRSASSLPALRFPTFSHIIFLSFIFLSFEQQKKSAFSLFPTWYWKVKMRLQGVGPFPTR